MGQAGPSERIGTRRLLLRCWRPEDAALLKHAIDGSLDHLRAWMPWAMAEPSPLPVLEARLAKFRNDFLSGTEWLYGIFDPAEHQVLGGAGLHRRQGPGVLEIGYWVRADVTGQGYATEAAAALTRTGFRDSTVERMEIRCDPRNLRSAAVPRRLGYRHARTLERDANTPDGQPRDTMVWELARREFSRARS
jgi:RimJ/RimL family protein N-acetyltransferase